MAAHQCFLSLLLPVAGVGFRGRLARWASPIRAATLASWHCPWVGQVPGPPVRTLPGVSELWVKGQGSGVDLLGPSPPGEKATHLQERRDGNQGQTSRRAWVEGRRPDGWRPGPGLPPQLFLQVCDTPAPSILTWSKLKRKPMFYTNETNVFM